ncbi:MAG: 50S ribosomal protein L18 [Phycisphaerae bacterium]|nr:50S ribosomal protein L18 [Phycisphaerae bacterium]
MEFNKLKHKRRTRRKARIRRRITGTPDMPRLTVFRSLNHIYAQVIDDLSGQTIASASSRDKQSKMNGGGNCKAAGEVGKLLAERAISAGCSKVVFDRNGFIYHGRVKALADSAREGGLKF